jgi:hypothetical protein
MTGLVIQQYQFDRQRESLNSNKGTRLEHGYAQGLRRVPRGDRPFPRHGPGHGRLWASRCVSTTASCESPTLLTLAATPLAFTKRRICRKCRIAWLPSKQPEGRWTGSCLAPPGLTPPGPAPPSQAVPRLALPGYCTPSCQGAGFLPSLAAPGSATKILGFCILP